MLGIGARLRALLGLTEVGAATGGKNGNEA